jgi:hypothetical protein
MLFTCMTATAPVTGCAAAHSSSPAGARSTSLAHMVLRQVDRSLRHHPATPATAHHLRLARLVAADLAEPS